MNNETNDDIDVDGGRSASMGSEQQSANRDQSEPRDQRGGSTDATALPGKAARGSNQSVDQDTEEDSTGAADSEDEDAEVGDNISDPAMSDSRGSAGSTGPGSKSGGGSKGKSR